MIDFKDWSDGWLKAGYYVGYIRDNVRFYEHIVSTDLGHYEYAWPEEIAAVSTSGPFIPVDLEITKGYDKSNNSNQIWQLIFGIKGQVYIYVELPTNLHRHGIPKRAKPSSDLREVSHFEEYMSSFHEPTFLTEHFMMRPDTLNIDFSAYNPRGITQRNIRLNIFINKMITERIGTIEVSNGSVTQKPVNEHYREILDKLYKRLVPFRPLTLMPVRAPAAAPGGE